jgi:tRNA-modifying protein YgfZ
MHKGLKLTALAGLGVVRVRGPDAVKFLQGQLSNDVERLTGERSVLAGYHNPQGRTTALLRLLRWDADDILAVVPRELAPVVATRLSKYVLRAKVKIAEESGSWRVSGLVDGEATLPMRSESTSEGDLPNSVGSQMRTGDAVFVRVAGEPPRWLIVSPAAGTFALADCDAGTEQAWRRFDVAAGQPQVYAATSEEFVAQMLNLDVLDAIAFDKGCYTGQEVIARAHYRGRVKRRMQRFVSREPCQLEPGASGQLADGRSFKVVLAAQLDDGRCDFLAVAPLVAGAQEATESGASAGASGPGLSSPGSSPLAAGLTGMPPVTASLTTAPTVAAAAALSNTGGAVAAPLAADQIALPYSLPD